MKIFDWTSHPEKLVAWNTEVKITDKRGHQYWYVNGELHRNTDRPAIVYSHGSKFWYKNGEGHREGDKPSVVRPNGRLEWWRNGYWIADNLEDYQKWVKNTGYGE